MRITAFVIAALLLPAGASAQIGNAGFMAPDTRFQSPGVPEPNQPNTTDKLFAQLVAEGGLAEVTLGELAAERAEAPAVGEFARRMIEDHSRANDELAELADRSGIPLPDELNPEHQMLREQLEGLEGEDFDLAYMRGQVVDHQKTTQLLTWEIGFGQDAELQRFAAEILPTVLDHLRLAQEIVADLVGNEMLASATELAAL